MSAEYRPVSAIPFHVIDKRLEKYGIKVEHRGAVTALIGPLGTLFATPDGNNTHFERKFDVDTQAVLDSIEREYGIEIVDENDHRFWGFASHDDLLEACCRPGRPTKISPRSWVLIEGPSIGDAEFAKQWLEVALKADQAMEAYFKEHSAFRQSIQRVEIASLVEFAPSAMAFVRMWLSNIGVFAIDLFDCLEAELFSVMAAAGFFTRTGQRYQMTIPERIDVLTMRDALLQLAETEDEHYFLHPERLSVTLTSGEAENWKCRLEGMDWRQRLADREALLEN